MMSQDKSIQAAIGSEVVIKNNPTELAEYVAHWFTQLVNTSIPPVNIALCGGSTPQGLYRLLGTSEYRQQVDWKKIHLFWGDERFVPHNDPQSNYRMVSETLLKDSPVPLSHIHPMPVNGSAEEAALQYQDLLKRLYGSSRLKSDKPFFTINFLGLGDDGHIASLLPNQPVLNDQTNWVASVPQGRSNIRLTLTYPMLNSSSITAFIVTGKNKADIVKRACSGDRNIPAGLLKPQGKVIWFLDCAAASKLEETQ